MSLLPVLGMLLFFSCFLCNLITVYSFSCLDEMGLPVDHWVTLTQNEDYQYYWHDPVNGFVKSKYFLNQTTEGSIMATANQLYSPDLDLDNVAYALYNDDPPPPINTPSSTYAHSKGMILTNFTNGFWLIHSKPNWPNPRDLGATVFPDSTYAQSLMCISFNSSTINMIATAQMVNFPFIYDSYLASNLSNSMEYFESWINLEHSAEENMTNTYASLDGVEYTHFAKNKNWGKDLYEDLVAPGLDEDLNVETWRLGSGGRFVYILFYTAFDEILLIII